MSSQGIQRIAVEKIAVWGHIILDGEPDALRKVGGRALLVHNQGSVDHGLLDEVAGRGRCWIKGKPVRCVAIKVMAIQFTCRHRGSVKGPTVYIIVEAQTELLYVMFLNFEERAVALERPDTGIGM